MKKYLGPVANSHGERNDEESNDDGVGLGWDEKLGYFGVVPEDEFPSHQMGLLPFHVGEILLFTLLKGIHLLFRDSWSL